MSDHLDLDTSELRTLAVDLSTAPLRLALGIAPIVKRGATQIKAQLREEMSASAHFRSIAGSITYDLDADGLGASIGPETGDGEPGNLANIAYFGPHDGSGGGTVPDPLGALEAEQPKFEKALLDLLGGVL